MAATTYVYTYPSYLLVCLSVAVFIFLFSLLKKALVFGRIDQRVLPRVFLHLYFTRSKPFSFLPFYSGKIPLIGLRVGLFLLAVFSLYGGVDLVLWIGLEQL